MAEEQKKPLDCRIGLVTIDPYGTAEDFKSKGIEYVLLSGDNKPEKETCFITLSKIPRDYLEKLKRLKCTEGFSVLRNPEELVNYIKHHLD